MGNVKRFRVAKKWICDHWLQCRVGVIRDAHGRRIKLSENICAHYLPHIYESSCNVRCYEKAKCVEVRDEEATPTPI